jgi:polyisoprenoid-binding protein YceI
VRAGRFALVVGWVGALCAGLAAAQADTAGDVVYDIDPKHTFPTFEVKHLGISTHRGRFNSTSGKVILNPEAKTGRIDILIDTSTVDTGDSKLEDILRDEDFFHVAKFKTATFVSNNVEYNAQGKPALARGDLTLRGVTRPVTVSIGEMRCTTFLAVRYVCGADITATIKRSEFGMTIWRLWVSDDVKLQIQVEAVRQQPSTMQSTPVN